MSAAQKKKQSALLRATGYEDAEALTLKSTEGDVPSGRELSVAWLAGTVMTGLTSVLLMGAALYTAFSGQDTFSTPFDALTVERAERVGRLIANVPSAKTDRLVTLAETRSEREIVEASIRVNENGLSLIRQQGFDRIRATLATSKTELAEDIPDYDPVALLSRTQSTESDLAVGVSTDIYGSEIEGEVVIANSALTFDVPPPSVISDRDAAEFVRTTVEGAYAIFETAELGYAPQPGGIIELSSGPEQEIAPIEHNQSSVSRGEIDENSLGSSERVITIRQDTLFGDALSEAGLTETQIASVQSAMPTVSSRAQLRPGDHLRIFFGPNKELTSLVPQRVSVYGGDNHRVTAALTDGGFFVTGIAPPDIEFPEEDVEEVNVNNLPSIYRSIWETGRKYEIADQDIDRIVAMYAYDLDLTRRIQPGDSIEILQTQADDAGEKQLLYVSLTLGGVEREFYRYQADDGSVGFYDSSGETGKRFLTRRPLEGGGNLRSRFGYRIHPIFGTRKLHTGVDLAARTGTPIYASGDGVVLRAQWVSGYGRFIELQHVNGYSTRYAHMSRLADGMSRGVRVQQGQIIGYVGSTGYSTGPHLHFEIRVNDNPVDPLSVRLPRANTLPTSEQAKFAQTVAQIEDLMQIEVAPSVTIASLN